MQVKLEDVTETIRQAKIVDAPDSLRQDIKLTDQGIDSLDMFSVILALQEKYSIEIPDEDIDRLNTINELVAYLNTRVA